MTRRPRDRKAGIRVAGIAIAALSCLTLGLAHPAAAEPGVAGEHEVAFSGMSIQDQIRTLLDNDYYKIHLDMRFRIEVAGPSPRGRDCPPPGPIPEGRWCIAQTPRAQE